MTPAFRSGLVALTGRPNVGKSTLANALARSRVAAVSPRPQPTRRRITAVVHGGDDRQAVLLDQPGLQRLRASGRPTIMVLNKIDGLDRDAVARAIVRASELVDFVALHPVSALDGTGIDALRDDLPQLLGEGPRYFPKGAASDQTEEELAGEMVREAALVRLRQEIPHALAVSVEEIEPARTGLVVRASVIVETESQKGIVVGKGGAMIRAIGTAAREALGHVWGTEVHLDLTVKVRRRWREDESMLERLGL